MENSTASVAVVMVPCPVQSHLNQLIKLSDVISSHGLPVHFIGSATHNRQARTRALNSTAGIQFHDFRTPPIATPDPPPNSRVLPTQFWPSILAYIGFRDDIGRFVQELSQKNKRVVIIHDRFMMDAVVETVSIPNAERYAFNCPSALYSFYIEWEALGKPFDVEGVMKHLPPGKEFFADGVLELMLEKPDHFNSRAGDIHNTTREVEGRYIDLLQREEMNGADNRQWAIMPTLLTKKSTANETGEKQGRRHKCLSWLDGQPPRSVIYISFGTGTSLSEEEIRELAMGIEQSRQNFLWILKEADRADIFAAEARKLKLPDGFEERTQEVGLIFRDWAPQLEILGHESVGGFMSHCGWNSCIESLSMGVPVAAWPMHSDQPVNAALLTDELGAGLIVRGWKERHQLVEAYAIKNAIERLMSSEEGHRMRKRAQEIGQVIKRSVEEGELEKEIQNFIAHITR